MHDMLAGEQLVYRRGVRGDGKRSHSIAQQYRLIAACAARSGLHIENTYVEKSDRATASAPARR